MARDKRKKTDQPSSKKTRAPKARRGFWATLFEPVAQDPDADFFFEEFTEEDDLSQSEAILSELLHDDAEEDGAPDDAVERITWEDGGPVVTDVPADGAYADEFAAPAQDDDAEDAYTILRSSFSEAVPEDAGEGTFEAEAAPEEAVEASRVQAAPDKPGVIELTAESVVVEEPPDSLYTPPAFLYRTPVPDPDAEAPEGYVPLTSSIDATYAQEAAPAHEAPAAEPAAEPAGYVPLTSSVGAETTMVPYAPSMDAVGNATPQAAADADATMVPYAPPATGMQPGTTGYVPLASAIDGAMQATAPVITSVTPAYGQAVGEDAGVPQAEWFDYASGAFARPAQTAPGDDAAAEPIDLFGDEDGLTDTGRQRAQTTRLFRTGTSATTRIHINETEETVRRAEAARRAEAREAKRRQDEAVARRSKKKKRSTLLRSLFANIAFVLFFIAVVIVALYYGFLLSDIVVMGNMKYRSEDIIKTSGLTPGTHMLFCDLDEAAAKIAEDPYIQVESVTYIFPNRVRIIVSERVEVAGIAGLDYNVIIDDQGYVLSMTPGTDLSGLLQVSGISMTGFRLGQKLGEGNDFSTATLIELIGVLEQYELMDDVKSIDLTTPLAITMKADNGLTIHVGQGVGLDAKMSLLARLLPRFVEQSINVGTLYLSAKGGAVYSPPYAAGNAQPIQTDGVDIIPPDDAPGFVDDDGDGLDDVTGLPAGASMTPAPGTTPSPSPAPTAYVPGGGADDFSG